MASLHGEGTKKKNPLKPFDCWHQSRRLIHTVGITMGDAQTRTPKMNKHVDRAQAEQCRQLSTLAPKVDDKAFWLRLAEDWTRLAELVADIGQTRRS
jgi:hypothetical protein